MSEPEFWADSQKSSQAINQIKSLKASIQPWEAVHLKHKELAELAHILEEKETDLIADISRNLDALTESLAQL
ncbi:PCRF domain-containing protein, partial [Candidatus Omnitrophota bacterium]